jgi:hypothetical protein
MAPATNRQDSQSGFRGPCIFFVFQRAQVILKSRVTLYSARASPISSLNRRIPIRYLPN